MNSAWLRARPTHLAAAAGMRLARSSDSGMPGTGPHGYSRLSVAEHSSSTDGDTTGHDGTGRGPLCLLYHGLLSLHPEREVSGVPEELSASHSRHGDTSPTHRGAGSRRLIEDAGRSAQNRPLLAMLLHSHATTHTRRVQEPTVLRDERSWKGGRRSSHPPRP